MQSRMLTTKNVSSGVSNDSSIDVVFVRHFLDFGEQTTISEIRASRLKGRYAQEEFRRSFGGEDL